MALRALCSGHWPQTYLTRRALCVPRTHTVAARLMLLWPETLEWLDCPGTRPTFATCRLCDELLLSPGAPHESDMPEQSALVLGTDPRVQPVSWWPVLCCQGDPHCGEQGDPIQCAGAQCPPVFRKMLSSFVTTLWKWHNSLINSAQQ